MWVVQLFSSLAVAVMAFAVLAALYVPLERVFAARPHRLLRRELATDLAFFVLQHALWTTAVVASLRELSRVRHALLPALEAPALAELAAWQQALIALLLGDVLLYFGHRLQHRVPLLWRFHRVHHTAVELDWIAAFREHPLDGLYTRTLVNLPAVAFGFPLETIAGVIAFRGLWAVFIHANVRLDPGPLKYVLGAPRLHLWHHARGEGPARNFANLLPALDVVFGTYHEPGRAPAALGADGPVARGYLGHLLAPFRPETPKCAVPGTRATWTSYRVYLGLDARAQAREQRRAQG